MNIVIFNVKYSNNVGDGIVAETTEHVLRSLDSHIKLTTFDLGGRTSYGASGIASPSFLKQIIHNILQYLPSLISDPLRVLLTQKALGRKVEQIWSDAIHQADHIVIGGGQLIADTDLYFPIRLSMIMQLARKYQKPVYLHAVGVSDHRHFSAFGRKLMQDIFKNNALVHYASVRDDLSAYHYNMAFGTMPHIVPDTGLFSSETYAIKSCMENTGQTIGIGVVSADAVHSHTAQNDTRVVLTRDDYIAIGQKLIENNLRPVYFTNGAPEDHAILEDIQATFPAPDKACFAPRPITAEDLVHIIAGCSKVVAHRLHATIVATSLGIPVVGFQWDKKLKSFFDYLGKADYCLDNFNLENLYARLNDASPAEKKWDIQDYSPLLNKG